MEYRPNGLDVDDIYIHNQYEELLRRLHSPNCKTTS